MTQRLIVFTDPDDNTLLVELDDARVQLSGVDSRPALAGDELRRFVGELFRRYAAPRLCARIAAAATALDRARDQLAGAPAGVRAAVARARAAVAAVHGELAAPAGDEIVTRHRRAPRPARGRASPYARAWQRPAWLPAELPVAELLAYRRGAWPPVPITSSSGRPR